MTSHQFGKPYVVREVPTPRQLQSYDLLVKVAVASYCHTDAAVAAGLYVTHLPCTASHEGSGTVVAVGEGVTDFKQGDRVMNGIYRNACGACFDCQEENPQYCQNSLGMCGFAVDGNFQEYVIVDSRMSVKIPEEITFEQAAPLACAGITIWRSILQAKLKAGSWLALLGSGGGLGHIGIQFAKYFGLKVIGIDARDEGIALSQEFGADLVVDARQSNDLVVKAVHEATDGRGADVTINISYAESAAATACAVTKMHGTMIQLATTPEVIVPFAELVFRDLRIESSLISSPKQAREMLDVVAKSGIQVKVNSFKGIEKIQELADYANSGKMQGKAIMVIDEEQVTGGKR